MIKEAIILAGGLGTRLRTVVSDVPKCMAPVNGTPFINFIVTYLKNEGVTRFILSLGYKKEIVIEYLTKTFPDLDIEYVIEDSPLGTGGAIQKACSKVQQTDVLVLNGDTLFNINLNKLSEFHIQHNADFTMALKEMKDFSRYGSVEMDTDNRLMAFHEKKYCEEGLINAGVYALKVSSLLEKKLPDTFSFEKQYLEKFIVSEKFYGLICDYYFIDIGIPEDYNRFIEDYNLILSKSEYQQKDAEDFIGEAFFEGLISIFNH